MTFKTENDDIEGYDLVHFQVEDIFGLDFAYPDRSIGQVSKGVLLVESSTAKYAQLDIRKIPELLGGTLQRQFKRRTKILKSVTSKSLTRIMKNEEDILRSLKTANLEVVA